MASIMWWNVERLGLSTDADIRRGIDFVSQAQNADYEIYCELTQTCMVMTPLNLTYRKNNSAQLCYGARDRTGADLPMWRITPDSTPAYKQAGYKGGNDFTNLADRALASLGLLDGANVYAFHAPASNQAIKAVSFLACYLDNIHGAAPWLLIGDMNVVPTELQNARVGIVLSDLILSTGQRTHQNYGELDYALTNIAQGSIKIGIVRANHGFKYSDHKAIWVRW